MNKFGALKVHGCYKVFAVVAWACYRWQQHACLPQMSSLLVAGSNSTASLDRCVIGYKWLADRLVSQKVCG